jgi:hypothetical protein
MAGACCKGVEIMDFDIMAPVHSVLVFDVVRYLIGYMEMSNSPPYGIASRNVQRLADVDRERRRLSSTQ